MFVIRSMGLRLMLSFPNKLGPPTIERQATPKEERKNAYLRVFSSGECQVEIIGTDALLRPGFHLCRPECSLIYVG